MQNRRDFLKTTGLAGTTLMVPNLFRLSAPSAFTGKRLVVVQLSGGNDWLNTVVPYRNDIYYKSRPRLAINQNEVNKLTDELGLHPSLKSLNSLFDEGEMAIFQGVGYPEPNRSHFRSMDIWHTATDGKSYSDQGWLGHWSQKSKAEFPSLEINENLSLAMKANQGKSLAISNLNGIKRIKDDRLLQAMAHSEKHDHDMASYLYQTAVRVTEGADYLSSLIKPSSGDGSYPSNTLSADLRIVANLMKSGAETRVFYTSISGFDTHANQKGTQERLLKNVDESIQAFKNDLKQANLWDDTLVMVFSEFGRRVAQNAGGGTDHGTAGNLWLMSGGLKKPGLRGEMPSLQNLDQGDLVFNTDFREVYAGILHHWLKSPNTADILGPIIKTAVI
ncbi:DUF1501 domain-containing protein [Cryomorphaceae bacterium 1068]|nr:DUF1501 domain-containing protein [Cryomorphaceae bacterium 1068]